MSKAFKFLGIVYSFSIVIGLILYNFNLYGEHATSFQKATGTLIIASGMMMAPAYATVALAKFNIQEWAQSHHLSLKNVRWLPLLVLPIIALVVLSVVLLCTTFVFGHIFSIELVGKVALEHQAVINSLTELVGSEAAATADLPSGSPLLTLFPLGIASAIISGFTINGLFAFGEEIGWRGLLMDEWESMGWHKMNISIGIVWGLWHAPIILLGHNYPHYPILGVFMMVLYCIPLSYLLAHLKKCTNSILGPSVLHGMINAMASVLVLLILADNELIGGIVGLAGAISTVIAYWFVKRLSIRFDWMTKKESLVINQSIFVRETE